MKNDQRPGGLFCGISYDVALKATATSLREKLFDDQTAAMLPLEPRLHDIHAMLRRVWPKDFPFSDFSDDAEMLKRATPKQKAAWHLSQMTLVLQRMVRAASPDIESIANLAIDIGLGVMAIAATKQDNSKVLQQILDGQQRLVNEQRRRNDQTDLALRHAKIMEEVAQDATKNPVDAAMDIYKQMPMDDEARAVREAVLRFGSIRKAGKELGIGYSKARRIVQKKIIPAYAKAKIPAERVFLMRPSIGFRKAPSNIEEGDNPANAPERDLYQQSAGDSDENES